MTKLSPVFFLIEGSSSYQENLYVESKNIDPSAQTFIAICQKCGILVLKTISTFIFWIGGTYEVYGGTYEV